MAGANLPDKIRALRTLAAERKIALVSSVAGIVLVGGYFLFRWRENNGHHPEYGDIATWFTFIAAAVGIPFAIYQFTLQRRQLAEQQKTIAEEFERQLKRDELLDAQLAQARAAMRALSRQQAEKVDLEFTTSHTDRSDDNPTEPGSYMLEITNNSTRPIWRVKGLLEIYSGRVTTIARTIASYEDVLSEFRAMPEIWNPSPGSEVRVIKPGEKWGFVFPNTHDQDPDGKMSVIFSDDADLRWKIDHDLHLHLSDEDDEL